MDLTVLISKKIALVLLIVLATGTNVFAKTSYLGEELKLIESDNQTYVSLEQIKELLGLFETEINGDKVLKNAHTVTNVVDGDTIKVDFYGITETVRLLGVDSPESVHPDKTKNTSEGIQASEFTKSYLLGKRVILETDVKQRDVYGRLLAYVYVGDKMYNQLLLTEGFAKVSIVTPNSKGYAKEFLALQLLARESKKGIWEFELEDEFSFTVIEK